MSKQYEYKCQTFLLIVFFSNLLICSKIEPDTFPRVTIAVVALNKNFYLPYFLSCLEQIAYPKKRIRIWFKIEDTQKDSLSIVEAWSANNADQYISITIRSNITVNCELNDEHAKAAWARQQSQRLIELREEGLIFARSFFADFIFMLDPDTFITYPDTLKILVHRNYPVAAPMLLSDSSYSNFWVTPTSRMEIPGQGTRTYDRLVTRKRRFMGCSNQAMLHSAVLISLRRDFSISFSYDPKNIKNYDGPENDVSAFSESVRRTGVNMKLCNDFLFGYIAETDSQFDTSKNLRLFINLKVDAISRVSPLPLNDTLKEYVSYPKPSRLSFDKIYMINLERRPERKKLMRMCFKELGMEVKRISAVDGRTLNATNMKVLNINLMKNYEDPFHKRPMKAGEIGCFISHYSIWNKIVRKRYNLTMVLEDDVRFTANFREKLKEILWELRRVDFDLLYLGRKILSEGEEEQVTIHTTKPHYSYWTLGYVLTYKGARKLLDARPLQNLLPVDEFIPIMFDQHPNSTWKSYFPKRDLKALSANPLLLFPTHYVGMQGYVSDTEVSYVIDLKNHRINRG